MSQATAAEQSPPVEARRALPPPSLFGVLWSIPKGLFDMLALHRAAMVILRSSKLRKKLAISAAITVLVYLFCRACVVTARLLSGADLEELADALYAPVVLFATTLPNGDIADLAFAAFAAKKRPASTLMQGVFRLASEVYRLLINVMYQLQSRAVLYAVVALSGHAAAHSWLGPSVAAAMAQVLRLTSDAVLHATNAFEYKWGCQRVDVEVRLLVVERMPLYFVGFGLVPSALGCFVGGLDGAMLSSLLFPLMILTALRTSPAGQLPRRLPMLELPKRAATWVLHLWCYFHPASTPPGLLGKTKK